MQQHSPNNSAEQRAWWNPAEAVTYLRDGSIPERFNWRSLLEAAAETQRLEAAIQSGSVEAILVFVDGGRRQLNIEERAGLGLRFREIITTAGLGVAADIIDTITRERRREVKTLLLQARDVRALHNTATSAVEPSIQPSAEMKVALAKQEDIEDEISKLYDEVEAEGKKPPNINELPALVMPRLSQRGLKATGIAIKTAGAKFAHRRSKPGKHWHGPE